jgi:hypothetical protein
MANQCVIDVSGVTGTLSDKYANEVVTQRFRISLDAANRNIVNIAELARAANPTQFPLRGQAWPDNPTYGLYAKQFQFEPMSELLTNWKCTVSYQPLEPGESNTGGVSNPLLWPATYSADWVEYEEAVTEAKNVEAFTGGPGRAALTLGPVVNTAYQEFDEGLYRTVREMVLNIHRNLPSLDAVAQLNYDFQDTTNSDTYKGQGARRWMFLGAVSPGIQTANGIDYWPTTISVHLKKTTDRKINNVGWKNLNFDGDVVAYKILDDESDQLVDVSEPAFLSLTGARAPDTPLAITYRYLTETAYASLG